MSHPLRCVQSRVNSCSGLIPSVYYTYYVEGVSYSSSKSFFPDYHNGNKSEDVLKFLSQKYPTQGKISVYFNPDHPSISVLTPGQLNDSDDSFIGHIIIFLIGLLIIAFAGFKN